MFARRTDKLSDWLWLRPGLCFMTDAGSADGGDAGGGGAGAAGAGAEGAADAGADAGSGGGDGAATAASAPSPGWQAGLPADIRDHPALKGHDSLEKLAREHINVQGLIGRKGFVPPEDGADDAAWAEFYKGLPGVPDDPGKYEIKPAEGREFSELDQAFHGHMRPVMQAAGLSQRQVDLLANAMNEFTGQQEGAIAQRQEQFAAQSRQALEREHGDRFAEARDEANRMAKIAFGETFEDATKLQLADGTFLLDHPLMFNAFQGLFAAIGEDGALPGGAGGLGGIATPEAAAAEIRKINAARSSDPEHVLNNRNHPEHQAMSARLQRLYEKAGDLVE